ALNLVPCADRWNDQLRFAFRGAVWRRSKRNGTPAPNPSSRIMPGAPFFPNMQGLPGFSCVAGLTSCGTTHVDRITSWLGLPRVPRAACPPVMASCTVTGGQAARGTRPIFEATVSLCSPGGAQPAAARMRTDHLVARTIPHRQHREVVGQVGAGGEFLDRVHDLTHHRLG